MKLTDILLRSLSNGEVIIIGESDNRAVSMKFRQSLILGQVKHLIAIWSNCFHLLSKCLGGI